MAKTAPRTNPPAPKQTPNQANGNGLGVNISWSGPLPPPGALQQFDAIIPDGANRIMTMIEAEQRHRIDHETRTLTAITADTKRGQWMGVTISVTSVLAAVAAAYLQAPAAVSISLVGIPVLGMIKAIVGSRSK